MESKQLPAPSIVGNVSDGFAATGALPSLDTYPVRRNRYTINLKSGTPMVTHESHWEASLYGTGDTVSASTEDPTPSRKNALKPDVGHAHVVLLCHPFDSG
jgi:hypothetical protein